MATRPQASASGRPVGKERALRAGFFIGHYQVNCITIRLVFKCQKWLKGGLFYYLEQWRGE
jgi:hypothetical protein